MAMIKMAVLTGLMVAGGYLFVMNATMNIALNQVNSYEQQYQHALQLADQIATSEQSSNR